MMMCSHTRMKSFSDNPLKKGGVQSPRGGGGTPFKRYGIFSRHWLKQAEGFGFDQFGLKKAYGYVHSGESGK